MAFLNTIIELEGPIVDVRPRWWAAHRRAIEAVGFDGPDETEFWRLARLGAPAGQFVPLGKPHHVDEYVRLRDAAINSTELMALDAGCEGLGADLRVLKDMGACHLATLCDNRAGINATLDRLDIWMHFERKIVLSGERARRVAGLKEMMGQCHSTLVVAGTVAFAYAAGEAGGRVAGIKGGPAFPKLLRQVGVDVFFDSLDELTDALARRDPALQRIGLAY